MTLSTGARVKDRSRRFPFTHGQYKGDSMEQIDSEYTRIPRELFVEVLAQRDAYKDLAKRYENLYLETDKMLQELLAMVKGSK
jgi:hypothetical protein